MGIQISNGYPLDIWISMDIHHGQHSHVILKNKETSSNKQTPWDDRPLLGLMMPQITFLFSPAVEATDGLKSCDIACFLDDITTFPCDSLLPWSILVDIFWGGMSWNVGHGGYYFCFHGKTAISVSFRRKNRNNQLTLIIRRFSRQYIGVKYILYLQFYCVIQTEQNFILLYFYCTNASIHTVDP